MDLINKPTADVADILNEKIQSCDIQFIQYGKITHFAGKITTVKCFQDNGLVKKLLATHNPGGVLIVDGAASLHTALVGDNLTKTAWENGWVGLIIYGAIRDSSLISQISIGVKALGTNPRKSTKLESGEINCPISFGGVTFYPEQYVISDEDGLVVLPDKINTN